MLKGDDCIAYLVWFTQTQRAFCYNNLTLYNNYFIDGIFYTIAQFKQPDIMLHLLPWIDLCIDQSHRLTSVQPAPLLIEQTDRIRKLTPLSCSNSTDTYAKSSKLKISTINLNSTVHVNKIKYTLK